MLFNKKLTIVADVIVDDEKIASCGAVLNAETGDMSFYHRQIDKEACKANRNIVRADQAEFEDFAYQIQEDIKAKLA